ncbi:sialin-like [Planococcus citri]|uniref:sialin-like n=1 Tax=Planococcus citri TaxID=170843 RepID=UPI0031F75184
MSVLDKNRNNHIRVHGSNMKSCTPLQSVQDMVPARLVLYMLSFTGFLVSFMMRTDINIAMVAMAKADIPKTTNSNLSQLYCYTPVTITNTNDSVTQTSSSTMEEGEFDWDSTTQSIILGSFYWCYVFSQVIGGLLTQYFGTKVVFGYSQFVTAICSLLIPQAAVTHYVLVIILRSIQGIASGLTWPAMYALVGKWIPSKERSRFMSSFQGFSFGIGLTYPLCGFLIARYGWRSVFYTTGTLGVMWCFIWWVLAFDAPQKHPRITRKELDYIECGIGDSIIMRKGLKVPWMSIFTSLPAWSIGVTTFGRIWVHYTFIISGPKYMKSILGFDIQTNGLMSGTPFLCSYFASVVFCYAADFLIIRKVMNLTNIRKLFTALSQVVPGLLVLLIIYFGCDKVLILITWFSVVTLITASYAGAMANIVDIAPNFAGPVLAFAQTIHMSASFLSPIVNGFLLQESPSLDQWSKVFQVTSAVAIVTYFSFQFFGTAEVQKWNYPDNKLPSSLQQEGLLPDDKSQQNDS